MRIEGRQQPKKAANEQESADAWRKTVDVQHALPKGQCKRADAACSQVPQATSCFAESGRCRTDKSMLELSQANFGKHLLTTMCPL